MQFLNAIELVPGIGNESNVYLVDGELLIDTGTGRFFPELRRVIEQCARPRDVARIVNTHAHFDNGGGNKQVRDWLGAELLVHQGDVDAVQSGELLADRFYAAPKCVTVNTELQQGDKIKTTHYTLDVLSTPGHTPGSLCLYDKKTRVLFCGDTVLDDCIARTDLPRSDLAQLKRSLLILADYPVKYLFPGHGRPRIDGIPFMLRRLAHASAVAPYI